MKMPGKNTIIKWFVSFNLILILVYLITIPVLKIPSNTIKHWFDLNAESNISTWLSSVQLFFLFLLSIIYAKQIDHKPLRRFYSLLGFVFLFFSADETSGIHEGLTKILRNLSFHSFFPNTGGFWIIIYPIILIVLGAIFWKGLFAFLNEKTNRTAFMVGAVVFVMGGVGFEVLGYYLSFLKLDSVQIIEIIVEESFELFGQTIMIYALLSKLYSHYSNTEILQDNA